MKTWVRLPVLWNKSLRKIGRVAFDVVCPCGQSCQGARQAQARVLPCPRCGKKLFILPLSALPPVPELAEPPAPVVFQRLAFLKRPWSALVLVGSGVLLLAIIAFAMVNGSQQPTTATGAGTPLSVEASLDAGQQALRSGDFPRAYRDLESARTRLANPHESLPAPRRRLLFQLHRQAALLADWLQDALEQVLARSASLNDDEWRVVLAGYRGKAAVFDVEVRRDAAQQLHVRSHRPRQDLVMHLEVHNLELMKHLPLNDAERVVFGARVGDVRRLGANVYAVQLEPASGVLLTDVNLIELGLQVPDAVIERQRRWLEP